MKLSVIIPVLNEASELPGCLKQFGPDPDVEVIVVDGGSVDATPSCVLESGVGVWEESPEQGRGAQMNHGAALASGDVFLFLHADTRLPAGWSDAVRASISGGSVGGRFRLRLGDPGVLFRCIGVMSTWRSKVLGITYGDQAIYVRRKAFDAVGGFPGRRIFEDSEFCTALASIGRFDLLDSSVVTSARRWRKGGVMGVIARMWLLRLLYACSVPDHRLGRLYRDVR